MSITETESHAILSTVSSRSKRAQNITSQPILLNEYFLKVSSYLGLIYHFTSLSNPKIFCIQFSDTAKEHSNYI